MVLHPMVGETVPISNGAAEAAGATEPRLRQLLVVVDEVPNDICNVPRGDHLAAVCAHQIPVKRSGKHRIA